MDPNDECNYIGVPRDDSSKRECSFVDFETALKAFDKKCFDPDEKGSFSNCTRILKDSYGKAKTCETCVPEPECDQITPPDCGPDCQVCGCPEWGQTCTLPGLQYCPPIECPPNNVTSKYEDHFHTISSEFLNLEIFLSIMMELSIIIHNFFIIIIIMKVSFL